MFGEELGKLELSKETRRDAQYKKILKKKNQWSERFAGVTGAAFHIAAAGIDIDQNAL